MRRYLAIGSLGLGLCLLAVTGVSAEEANNRITANKITLNRIALNKIALNKISLNKIAINRISLNRIAINGLTAAPAGAGAVDDIVAIDLADGTRLTR